MSIRTEQSEPLTAESKASRGADLWGSQQRGVREAEPGLGGHTGGAHRFPGRGRRRGCHGVGVGGRLVGDHVTF